jgi:hypothetical protein
MMDLAAPSILRNEDSVDDITDYVFAYGNVSIWNSMELGTA